MVSRENQGLQIALVIFVVLTLASAVSCFVFSSNYNEAREKVARLELAVQTAEGKVDAVEIELGELKTILGVKRGDSLRKIAAQQEADFAALPGNWAEKKSYRELARQLASTLSQKDGMIIAGQKREIKLGDQIDSDEVSKQQEVGEYKDEFDQAAAEYLLERGKLKEDVNAAAKAKMAALRFFEKRQHQYDEDVLALRSYTQDLEKKAATLNNVNTQLFARLREKEPEAELVDARVKWVHQGSQTVWLDRGSADGLRPLVTFKVVDGSEPDPAPARSKATIEIVRVDEPHGAEARIISDEPTNPILPGDLLFSAAWHPGRVERFALTGFIDINGDGESDRALVKQLIQRAGGAVDAEVTDEGQLIGNVTVDTKYLIEGAIAVDRRSPDFLKNHTRIREQADYQCVRVLSVGKFLDYVGYRPTVRTVALKGDDAAKGFRPRSPEVPRFNRHTPVDFSPVRPRLPGTAY